MSRYSIKKFLAVAPNVLIAMLLTFPIASLLPPLLGLILFVGALVTVTLLLVGRGEAVAMRCLYFARLLTAAELAALTPALQLLRQRGTGPPRVELWAVQWESAVAAEGVGRRSVLVTGGLIAAIRAGRLPADQAAALIGHQALIVGDGLTRNDPAVAFWTLPWTFIRVIARACAARFQWIPAVTVAWRCRIVLGGIALVQGVQEGIREQAPGAMVGGILAGVVMVATYVLPYWERVWERTLRDVGDEHLRRIGLAPAYARLLLSRSRAPKVYERAHALTATQPALSTRLDASRRQAGTPGL